jgi:hypothetical protein
MISPTCDKHDCPSGDALTGLVRGQLPADRQQVLAEHVGRCPGCQTRLDAIATDGDPHLSDVVRHIDKSGPPSDSALWPALNKMEGALTTAFPVTPPPGDVRLDFLRPSEAAGAIGRISSFDVKRVIGRGGMGVVLQATDPYLSRDVAIKILDPQLAHNDLAKQRFCRESRAAAAVSHENVVGVYQVNDDPATGLPFLVMQLVNGESLEQRLRRVGKLSVPEAVRLGAQAAAGLAAAHAQGLIHRDVKPGNILIEAGTEKVKLTDFGLARATEDLKLTSTGFVAGTPLYMAPEQARGEEIDPRADLFSLGSVLYEALAGKPPFDGKTPLAVLRRVADEAHPRLRRLNRDVPDWLEDLIDRLLAKDPRDRIQSAAEVAELLTQHQALIGSGDVATAACGPGSGLALARKRPYSGICYKSLATVLAAFAGGGVVGGVGAWLFAPPCPGNAAVVPAIPPTTSVPVEASSARGLLGAAAGGFGMWEFAPVRPAVNQGPAPKAVFPGRSGAVWSVALSRDGGTLAIGTETGRIAVWDVAAQRLKFDLHPPNSPTAPAHRGPVWTLDFRDDGKTLVSASDDGTIKVWDVVDPKQTKALPVGTPIRAAAVAGNGHWVVVGDRSGAVRVFDISQDALLIGFQQESSVNAVAFAPDDMTVVAAGSDGSVVRFELPMPDMQPNRINFIGHTGPVYGVAYSHDGEQLATAGWDGSVIIWDVRTGVPLRTLRGDEEALAVQFTPCGKMLATAGMGGKARVWDADAGKVLAEYSRDRGAVHVLRFSRDGKLLASGGRDGTVRLWAVDCK